MNKTKILKKQIFQDLNKIQVIEYIEELKWNINFRQIMNYLDDRKNLSKKESCIIKTVLWIDKIDILQTSNSLFNEIHKRKISILQKLFQRLIHMFGRIETYVYKK